MQRYLIRRVISTLPVLFVSSIIVFMIIHFIPGDPTFTLLPPDPSPEQIEAVRTHYGFDRPLPEQYLKWLSNLSRGELGTSISNGFPVTTLLRQRIGVTAQLAVTGFIVALLISFPLGIAAGLYPRSIVAHFVSAYTTLGFVIPSFWLGILLILFFAVDRGWLPTSGFTSYFEDPVEAAEKMVLPAFTLSVVTSVILANFLRYSIEEVAKSEYVTAAVARGIPYHRILVGHILRNAMIPVVTVAALQFGLMLAGTVITESLFSVPGMGRLLIDAIAARDFAVLQGALLIIIMIFIVINFLTDILYAWLDPRIRLS